MEFVLPRLSRTFVAIAPKFQRQGLGKKLNEHSLQKAKLQNERVVIIMGFRKHYECYGFVGAKKYGISMEDEKYYYGLMALKLYKMP